MLLDIVGLVLFDVIVNGEKRGGTDMRLLGEIVAFVIAVVVVLLVIIISFRFRSAVLCVQGTVGFPIVIFRLTSDCIKGCRRMLGEVMEDLFANILVKDL